MNRQEKALHVEDFKQKFSGAKCAILADFQGLTVAEMTEFRRKLKAYNIELDVLKNRLAKRACKDTEWEGMSDDFKGTNIIGFAMKDPVPLFKTFIEFEAREESKLKIKTGYLEGKKLTLNEIKEIARLPSREELLAKVLGTLQAPLRGLVTVLSGVPRQFVQVLQSVSQSKGPKE